jgi:6-phosphogluconolactonase (cycloisomerase 2 family)
MRPISLALHENLLYVLNAGGRVGGQDNIAGFTFQSGRLLALAGSIRPLSGGDTDPAQIGFSPDGHVLVVTEKATGMIDTYTVDGAGLVSEHKMFPSAGPTPFGFAFRRQHDLIVSEAAGGMPDLSSVSSYEVSDNGDLEVISASVPTTETAACWVVVSLTGRYAYASNTGSGTISGFRVQRDGTLERIDEDGVTAESGMGPIDMAFNRTTRYLYVLNAGSRSISILQVGSHGSLTPVGAVTDLPAGSNGLVAR